MKVYKIEKEQNTNSIEKTLSRSHAKNTNQSKLAFNYIFISSNY